jgi:hypothetical protein
LRPHQLPPEQLFSLLLWGTIALAILLLLLVLAGGIYQARLDRLNQHRIACYQAWETQLSAYLFGGGYQQGPFPPVPTRDSHLFQRFLARYRATLAGKEADLLRGIYLSLGMHESLSRRLHDTSPKARAQAVQEIRLFGVADQFQNVVPLLEDPIPYVSHVAAQTLTGSQDLQFAQPVMDWALGQELYQRDRLLRVLEGFGPELLPWMEHHLPPPTEAPEAWLLFARLAGSHRHQPSEARLLGLLAVPDVDLQASAIRALAGLADPAIYEHILPLAWSGAWPIRAQTARALGLLGGPRAIPELLPLTADPVYEVRRNAAQGLADLGHAGIGALAWLADDPEADRFARDIARERLEWAQERGHL